MRLIAIIISAVLTQCSCSFDPSPQSVFDNYLYRLSNSLDVEIDLSLEKGNATHILTPYPKKTTLVYDIPAVNLNTLQFLQLSKCDLQRLIGQRNSSLGKLITGYHSLLYEHEFLLLAKRCQETIDRGKPLHAELTKVIQYKQNHQNQLRWNATFAGDEIRHLFSLSTRPLTPQQLSSKPIELVGALENLTVWLSKPTTNSIELQKAYKVFETRKYVGELRLTIAMAVSAITKADELIAKRLLDKPLCPYQQTNQKFEVVHRVFLGFYIGAVQPLLAKLQQQGKELYDLIDQIQYLIGPMMGFVEFWAKVYKSKDSEWKEFNAIIKKHTKSWQKLLAQCGRLPG